MLERLSLFGPNMKWISDISSLKDSVNKSITFPDPEGFNIRTIQKCISNAYKKSTKL